MPGKVSSQAIWTKKTSRNATATWHLLYPEIRSFSGFFSCFSCFSCFFPGSWLVPTLAAFALAACTWIARQNQAPQKSEKGKVLHKCRSHPWHRIFLALLLEVMSRMGPMDCTSAGKKRGLFLMTSQVNWIMRWAVIWLSWHQWKQKLITNNFQNQTVFSAADMFRVFKTSKLVQGSATRHRPPTFKGFNVLGVEQSITKSTASFSWAMSWFQARS